MNCHGENNKKQEVRKHSPLKHLLHMAICCGLPILVIGSLPLITRFSPSSAAVLERIAPFICPVMMLLMMPMMFRSMREGSCCDNKKAEDEKE